MRTLNLLIVGCSALALSACGGAATRFYTLTPLAQPGAAPSAYTGAAFRIDAVHIPASLDRPELVREVAGDRFLVSDNDHWSAPVGELIRRTLTQDLVARLPTGKVIFPDAPKLAGAGGLVVDILGLTPVNGQVTMDVSWTILPSQGAAPGRAPMPAHQRSARLTTSSTGAGVTGNAAELSALTDKLAEAIASDLLGPF